VVIQETKVHKAPKVHRVISEDLPALKALRGQLVHRELKGRLALRVPKVQRDPKVLRVLQAFKVHKVLKVPKASKVILAIPRLWHNGRQVTLAQAVLLTLPD
jgi:hypothetical protein